MSKEITDLIAETLAKHTKYVRNSDGGGMVCGECGWEVASKYPNLSAEASHERAKQHEAGAVVTALKLAGFDRLGRGRAPDKEPTSILRTRVATSRAMANAAKRRLDDLMQELPSAAEQSAEAARNYASQAYELQARLAVEAEGKTFGEEA